MSPSSHLPVGLLTYHHVVNEGAALQTFSLATALQKALGKNVEVIDYHSPRIELRDLRNALAPGNPVDMLSRVRGYRRIKRFARSHLPLSHASLYTDRYEKAVRHLQARHQAIVVGSDEVWKIDRHGVFARPFPNIYWLSPSLTAKKIAFAASANRTDYRALDAKDRAWITATLDRFALLGVRDHHTMEFLEHLGLHDDRVSLVPDPTFALDLPRATIAQSLQRRGLLPPERTALVLLSDPTLNAQVCRRLKSLGFHIATPSIRNPHADINWFGAIDPLEWAFLYGRVSACVTDRFHATVFCIRNNTPFLTVDHEAHYAKYESKTHSLLQDCGLLSHYVSTAEASETERLFDRIDRLLVHPQAGDWTAIVETQRSLFSAFLKRVSDLLCP